MANTILLVLITLTPQASLARVAPAAMKEFNKSCPAPKLCLEVNELVAGCKKDKQKCDLFIEQFEKLLPEYDCQRSFDATPDIKYIVPALWICDSRGEYLETVSKLGTSKAKRLFGSAQFRSALEGAGHLEEVYVPLSLSVSKGHK